MPERLLIRYSGPQAPLRGWRVGDSGTSELGAADSASAWPREMPVWVVVPAEYVGFARTELGVRNRDQLAKAVPFALEEQLAEPVEQLHFAIAQRVDGRQDAWWISTSRLRAWLDDLAQRSVTPTVLLADSALLTEQPGGPAWLRDGERALSAQDDFRSSVPVHALAEFAVDPALVVAQQAMAQDTHALVDALLWAGARAAARPASNLLTDAFAARHATAPMRTLWRTGAVLALVAMGLSIAWLFADTARLEQRRAELFEQQQGAYRSVQPAAQQIPDPVGQMRALERNRGTAGASFVALAADAAALLGSSPRVQLQQLDWRGDVLEMTLIGPDVAALDAFREQCAQLPGVEAELGSVGSIAGGSQGKIQLRRRPA
ncbi:MAG: type II secretion system protein GspL [Lysobacterales bacterium]